MTVAIDERSTRTTWRAIRSLGWRSWAFGAIAAGAAALVSVLLGATLAVGRHRTLSGARPLTGGVATYLAVGCPVCNKVVVMLLGTGGAMTWFAPLQPVIAVMGVLILATAVRSGVRSLQLTSCPVR